MTSKPGAPLDPGSPEYAWIRTVIGVVEKSTGQPSRWNGRVFFEEGEALGTAHVDGTMTVGDKGVLQPLRRAFAGEELTDAELAQVRDALVTLTHEALHLSGDIGTVDQNGNVSYTNADLALEEGLTETWSQQNVDLVIYQLGLDQKYPKLIDQPPMDAYPALQAASTKLVQGVATLANVRESEVIRRLQGAEWTERFRVMADLIIEQRLDGMTGDVAVVRADLEAPLREQFGQLMEIQGDKSLDYATKTVRGIEVGSAALSGLSESLNAAELAYGAEPLEHQWPPPTGQPFQPPKLNFPPPQQPAPQQPEPWQPPKLNFPTPAPAAAQWWHDPVPDPAPTSQPPATWWPQRDPEDVSHLQKFLREPGEQTKPDEPGAADNVPQPRARPDKTRRTGNDEGHIR